MTETRLIRRAQPEKLLGRTLKKKKLVDRLHDSKAALP
jgi:hypothetical protein